MPITRTSGRAYVEFRNLRVGAHYNVKGAGPGVAPLKKVSKFCYVYPTREYTKAWRQGRITGRAYKAFVKRWRVGRHCYASAAGLDTLVQPTGRTSPVRKRKGRGRGAATLGGLSSYRGRRRRRRRR